MFWLQPRIGVKEFLLLSCHCHPPFTGDFADTNLTHQFGMWVLGTSAWTSSELFLLHASLCFQLRQNECCTDSLHKEQKSTSRIIVLPPWCGWCSSVLCTLPLSLSPWLPSPPLLLFSPGQPQKGNVNFPDCICHQSQPLRELVLHPLCL